jgi:putative acetyltransferase
LGEHIADTSTVTIALADPRSAECLLLTDHSWAELNRLYGDVDRAEFFALDFSGAGSAFVVARQNGRAVGCGAFRPFAPGVAEVKRIFVEPEVRHLGIGRKIMSILETVARDLGYTALQLETGLRQPAAIRLYEKAGYQRIPVYGQYRDDPLSVCFGKVLTIGAASEAQR